jgi:O-methyltransferase involved in polyketide biosynthesis
MAQPPFEVPVAGSPGSDEAVKPFIFGFNPAMLAETLRPSGFLLQSDVSTTEAARFYCASTGRNETGSEWYRVATAIRAGA